MFFSKKIKIFNAILHFHYNTIKYKCNLKKHQLYNISNTFCFFKVSISVFFDDFLRLFLIYFQNINIDVKRKNAEAFFYLSKYITKTKQPLDLYIPICLDTIFIGGPGETRTPV